MKENLINLPHGPQKLIDIHYKHWFIDWTISSLLCRWNVTSTGPTRKNPSVVTNWELPRILKMSSQSLFSGKSKLLIQRWNFVKVIFMWKINEKFFNSNWYSFKISYIRKAELIKYNILSSFFAITCLQ